MKRLGSGSAVPERLRRVAGSPAMTRLRGRLGTRRGVLALVLVLVIAAVMLSRGGESSAPAGAAKLVPASALAYVHFVTDPEQPGVERGLRLARRLPAFRRLRRATEDALRRLGRTPVNLGRDVRPWLGDEAGAALLAGSRGPPASVAVLGVRDEAKAREFLRRRGRPTGTARYHGVDVVVLEPRRAYALAGGWLLLGPPAGVRAALDAQAGRRPALADDPVFRRAGEGESADRAADAYASAVGVRRVLAPQAGALGTLGAALDQPGLQGVALSLTPRSDRATLRAHWALSAGGGTPAGLPLSPFRPTLPGALPGPVTALVDVAGGGRALPGLIASLLPRSLARRFAFSGLDLGRDLGPLFSGETALALYSRRGRPAVLVVARVRSEARAREALAGLQGPLVGLLAPGAEAQGVSPTFTQRPLPGLTAFGLRLGPGIELDYAVGGGRMAISTDFGLLRALARQNERADEQPLFTATVAPGPERSTALGFADLKALLLLVEPAGLGADPRFAALAPDLRRIRALGFRATSGERESTLEITLAIP